MKKTLIILLSVSLMACQPKVDREVLQKNILTSTNDTLRQRVVKEKGVNVEVQSVSCIQDKDDLHYVCLAKTNMTHSLYFKVVCQQDGSCIWNND